MDTFSSVLFVRLQVRVRLGTCVCVGVCALECRGALAL